MYTDPRRVPRATSCVPREISLPHCSFPFLTRSHPLLSSRRPPRFHESNGRHSPPDVGGRRPSSALTAPPTGRRATSRRRARATPTSRPTARRPLSPQSHRIRGPRPPPRSPHPLRGWTSCILFVRTLTRAASRAGKCMWRGSFQGRAGSEGLYRRSSHQKGLGRPAVVFRDLLGETRPEPPRRALGDTSVLGRPVLTMYCLGQDPQFLCRPMSGTGYLARDTHVVRVRVHSET